MDFSLNFLRGYFALNGLFIFSCCVAFCVRRFLWRRRKQQGRRNLGFCPTYTSAGNALHALQVIAQPRVEYVLAEKFNDEADEDAEGGPDTPKKHLHRQLRRIRRGEKVDRLTVLRR
jgi:hypothetical protein